MLLASIECRAERNGVSRTQRMSIRIKLEPLPSVALSGPGSAVVPQQYRLRLAAFP